MKTEKELIEATFTYFKTKRVFSDVLAHERVFCATQIEIGGCIADGLIFIDEPPRNSRIIGLEAKTNQDKYKRLYNQVNSYLAICDEVYLVVEDKAVPQKLPFYVGVIRIAPEVDIVQPAVSLKHTINADELWLTLRKAFNAHCKVDAHKNTLDFFNAVENIKRKLIWNQFVKGFHHTYVKEYIALTEDEKRIVQAYFGVSYQKELCV